jgi:hypothetical protein
MGAPLLAAGMLVVVLMPAAVMPAVLQAPAVLLLLPPNAADAPDAAMLELG